MIDGCLKSDLLMFFAVHYLLRLFLVSPVGIVEQAQPEFYSQDIGNRLLIVSGDTFPSFIA